MTKDDILKQLESSGIQKISKDESLRMISGEDGLGFKTDDEDASSKQIRYIFVLGRELGLINKNDIKSEYGIESISSLTFGDAKQLIDQMEMDLGLVKDDDPYKVDYITKKEKKLKWTVENGIDFVGDNLAKCGHCEFFSGENTAKNGTCGQGVISGVFHGTTRAPMNKGCFKFKHGESEKVLVSEDYGKPPIFNTDDDDVF